MTELDSGALRRILHVTRDLAQPIDLATMLGRVIDAGRAVLGAERGTVFLHEEATSELVTASATGIGHVRIPANRGLAGECAQSRRVINVPDAYADSRFNREIDQATGYRTRCLLSVPLVGWDDQLVGVLQLLNKRDAYDEAAVFREADEQVALTLAAQCAVALQRVRLTEQLIEKQRLEQALAVARQIQTGILPGTMPPLAGYELAGRCRPAEETGGDVFDVVPAGEGRAMLLLGDATGHGVGPALSVVQVRAMLRALARVGSDLDTIVRHVNDQLEQDLPSGRFVTAFVGLLDAAAHRVSFHSGGQGPILHFRAAGAQWERHSPSLLPLGIVPLGEVPAQGSMDLAPGDIVALCTDGIFEAEGDGGALFGVERFERLVAAHRTEPLEALATRVLGQVDAFANGRPQGDDITLLLVRRA